MRQDVYQSSDMPKQVSLRLPDGIWERAEKLAKHMASQAEFQGLAVSPTRVLIQSILRGLSEIETEQGLSKKGRKR